MDIQRLKTITIFCILLCVLFVLYIIFVETGPLTKLKLGNPLKLGNILKASYSGEQNYIIKQGFDIPTTSTGRREIWRRFYKRLSPDVDVNCQAVVEGDRNLITYYMLNINYKRSKHSANTYLNMSNCEIFKQKRGYIDHPLSMKELEFPLAFGLLVYDNHEQIERLLRAIYRPQHVYCIHVDLNGNERTNKTYEVLKKIVNCFENVHLTENRVDIRWGEFSIMQAELNCLKYLWTFKKWKYYINLTGKEFPLKTNLEITEILKVMDGANVVFGSKTRARTDLKRRWVNASYPPHNITPIIGSTHVAINRDFVDFVLHNRISHDFISWLKKTWVSDETFFPSLNFNPHLGIPGSFLGEADEYPLNPFFMRYKNWARQNGVYLRECHGKIVRNICIFGLGDLSKAVKDIGLYANKFFYDYQPLAYDCLEEWLNEHTWNQYVNDEGVDTRYYQSLDKSKYQIRKGQNYTQLMW